MQFSFFFKTCVCFSHYVYLFPLGSIASKIFHDVLLDACTDLPLCCWPHDSGKKRKKDGQRNYQVEGKRSKPQRKDAAEVNFQRSLNTSSRCDCVIW